MRRPTFRTRALAAAALTGGAIILGAAPASAAISLITLTPSPSPAVVGQSLLLTMTCTFPDGEGGNNPVGYISFGTPEFFISATESGPTTSGGNVTFTYTRTVTPGSVATAVPIAGECDTGPDTQELRATVDVVSSAPTTTTAAPTTTTAGATVTTVAGTTATTSAVAGSELARTGTDAGPFLLLGGASLLTGLGLVRTGRRRNA
ncbi:MAG: LPXTG cell wall anchor domain-containing protein [Actinomycetes bacterium]